MGMENIDSFIILMQVQAGLVKFIIKNYYPQYWYPKNSFECF